MRKGVLAHDRLVELYGKAADGGDPAGDVHDLGAVDARLVGHNVIAHFQRHDDFLKRGIARPFAQPIDRAFDLARTRLDGGKAVCRRHAQIVVAMGGEYDFIRAGNVFQQFGDQLRAFARGGVSHGIGNVDRGGARPDGDFHDPVKVFEFRPRGVHGGPLHVVAKVPRMGHRIVDALGHFVLCEVRNGPVQRRGTDEGMDARLVGVFDRLPAAVDVGHLRPCKAADHRVLRLPGDFTDRLEVPFGGDGKARFDDIDAHFVQKACDFQLLGMGHGGAGALFAIPKGGVEYEYAVLLCCIGHVGSFILLCCCSWRATHPSERARRAGTLRGGLAAAGCDAAAVPRWGASTCGVEQPYSWPPRYGDGTKRKGQNCHRALRT